MFGRLAKPKVPMTPPISPGGPPTLRPPHPRTIPGGPYPTDHEQIVPPAPAFLPRFWPIGRLRPVSINRRVTDLSLDPQCSTFVSLVVEPHPDIFRLARSEFTMCIPEIVIATIQMSHVPLTRYWHEL